MDAALARERARGGAKDAAGVVAFRDLTALVGLERTAAEMLVVGMEAARRALDKAARLCSALAAAVRKDVLARQQVEHFWRFSAQLATHPYSGLGGWYG